MAKTTSIPLAQLAKAYALERLRLDPRAGTAIGDEFWIGLAGQLIRQDGIQLIRGAGPVAGWPARDTVDSM